MKNLFNHEAVTCIIRETIEHSLRFFDRVNERLVDLTKGVRPDMPLPRLADEMNKVCSEYRDEHRTLVTRMEKIWRETFDHIQDPKNRATLDQGVDTFKNMFDPNELLRLNRDVMNTTVSFFFKTGENLFKAFDPRHPITAPKDLFDIMDTARAEYVRRHNELTLEITNIMRTAVDPKHASKTEEVRGEALPTRENPIDRSFDLPEMIRLNREVIDNTVKFFLNLNENVIRMASNQEKGDLARHTTETLNRVCDDYRKAHQTITENVLNTTRKTFETAFKTRDLKINPIDSMIDREEMFKLNQETLASTVKFFLNLNDELVRSIREPGHPVSLDTMVGEYQRIHRILSSRIETIWKETLDRMNRIGGETPVTHPVDHSYVHVAKEKVASHADATVAGTPVCHPTMEKTCNKTSDKTCDKTDVTTKATKATKKNGNI